MPIKDPEKRRKYHRDYVKNKMSTDPVYKAKHMAKVTKNALVYAARLKDLVSEFRKKGCSKCKEKSHDVLCAHHKDPKSKEFSIADGMRRRLSHKRMSLELEKCVCLCLNCHAKTHANKRRREKRKHDKEL
jgi:Uri superfamily endonuclease